MSRGVLEVLDAVMRKVTCSDFWDVSVADMQEARATVERMAEALEKADAMYRYRTAMYAAVDSTFPQREVADERLFSAMGAVNDALRAYRGEQA